MEIIKDLLDGRRQKQMEIKEITAEVEAKVFKKMQDLIVFEGDANWPLSLLGSVASRICRQYQKPTFLFRIKETESRGAVRTPAGVNGVEMMKKCAEHLLTYGGHAPAAGFTIKNENLEKFKECLLRNYEKEYENTKK
jgi:single-stranded-DNA-specific exonuclease